MSVSASDVFEAHMTSKQRAEASVEARMRIEEYQTLRDLRKAMEMTQNHMATEMGITQDNVSRIERRSDVLLSTLRSYVEAMGGRLDLMVQFPDRKPVKLDGLVPIDSD